jgi:hypothetical protein
LESPVCPFSSPIMTGPATAILRSSRLEISPSGNNTVILRVFLFTAVRCMKKLANTTASGLRHKVCPLGPTVAAAQHPHAMNSRSSPDTKMCELYW